MRVGHRSCSSSLGMPVLWNDYATHSTIHSLDTHIHPSCYTSTSFPHIRPQCHTSTPMPHIHPHDTYPPPCHTSTPMPHIRPHATLSAPMPHIHPHATQWQTKGGHVYLELLIGEPAVAAQHHEDSVGTRCAGGHALGDLSLHLLLCPVGVAHTRGICHL